MTDPATSDLAGAAADPARGERPPLGMRFLVVWGGQTLSSIGTILSAVGVSVHVFVETGSAAWLGALAALAAVPYVVTGPLMTRVDRSPRRTVMIAADVVAALGSLTALALAVVGRLEVWHLVAAAFVGGLGNSFQFPAFQAAIPMLVDREALGRANGLNQFGPAVGIVVGPALATPLLAAWGVEAVLLVDVVTFVVAVAATALVRFGPEAATAGVAPLASGADPDDGTWRSTWAWLRTTGRPLVVLLVAMAIVNFLLAFFNVSLVALAADVGGTARAGLVLGAGGVAMVVGSIVVGRRGVPAERVRTFARALLLAGLGCAVAAFRPELGLLVVGAVVALVAVPAVNASTATIYHEWVPARMHGRVFGLRSAIGRALEPIGSFGAGLLIAHAAGPAMRSGGVGAETVGRVVGVGDDRGAALVLLACGLALALAGLWLSRSWINEALDGVDRAPASVDVAAASVTGV